jgi:hypothetical protein
MKRYVDALIAFALAFASTLLYLRTLAPDVVDADGGELQFAGWNFSFVHPTGYPLFLILGGLFQHLVPIGNPAYRLNIFTALTAAGAVATLYLGIKEMTQQRAVSIIAAASFALTQTFWYDASAAETYALNVFFIAFLILLALMWQREPTARRSTASCFVYGLALAHHRTIVLWLPAFVLFFIIVALKSRVPVSTFRLLPSAFLFFAPLLLYLYIPLRASASPYTVLPLAPGREIILYDSSPHGFVNYILGRVFQHEIGWDTVSLVRLFAVPQLLLDQFGAVGVVLGIVGFGAMVWHREWARLALLLTSFAATVLFASVYHIGDIVHYYVPAYLVWAVWIGVALSAVVSAATRYSLLATRLLPTFCLLLSVFFLPIFQLITNLPAADRSRETQAREQWTRILAAPIPQNAILISNDRDEMMPLWYMQYVENTRRDLLGLFPLVTPAPQHATIVRLTDSVLDVGRPVFFIKPMPGIEIKYRVAASDPLMRVLGRAADAPPQNVGAFGRTPLLGDRVRVLGYDGWREPGALRVAIYWQPRAKLERNYTTFAHLLDAHGNKVAQGNDHQVGGEFYPTSLWDVGETLRDEQVIALPPNSAPGSYRLLVGMYHQPDLEMLGEPVEIGAVDVK